jgi:murein DD-endopeptidase MepM/ murein hydrolase activator NlpD
MLISPPFLPQHDATDPDDTYLPRAMVNHGFGEGAFPLARDMAWHGGLHLMAPRIDQGRFEPVRAVADGTVMYVRQPKKKPESQADIDADPLGYNGWSDNGCVVIKHTTEIGEGISVTYFSITLHLKKIATGVAQGQPIYRKDEVGTAGSIDGTDNQIHFEIICDDDNLALLVGRTADPFNERQDGRSTALFGEIYVRVPEGAMFFAQAPAATAKNVSSSAPPVYTSTEDYYIGIRCTHQQGGIELTTYKKDGTVIGSPVQEPGGDYALYDRANTIALAYRTAKAATVPAASAVQQLLRLGRVLDPDTLDPPDVPHWRHVAYPGGQSWTNLHADGVHMFSDADFPPWRGWQLIDDDTNADSRAHSNKLLALILPDDQAANASDQQTPQTAAPGTACNRQIKALSRMTDKTILARLSRTICKFTTEWEKASFAARWQWLTTETPPDDGPMAGPYLHRQDFPAFQAHGEALCFWEEANLGINANHWHFHPMEFIRMFRQCGWLSHKEMVQLFPMTAVRPSKGTWVSEPVTAPSVAIENYRAELNKACRRYGIVTPLRIAAFYANAMQETMWFTLLHENNPETRYWPWDGRGFLQLTWPDNYVAYWRYTGKSVDDTLANNLSTSATRANTQRSNTPLVATDTSIPADMRRWRDGLADTTHPAAAADSACAYWAWSRAAQYADTDPANKLMSVTAEDHAQTNKKGQSNTKITMRYYTSPGMGSVAATVNLGHPSTAYIKVNGIAARFQAYNTCEVVLLDTPQFPTASGDMKSTPECYAPRHP